MFEAESTPQPYCGQKVYVNEKFRIEPATFRLVAQCLNQLRHPKDLKQVEGRFFSVRHL